MNKKNIDQIKQIPIWKNPIEIKKIEGGITNENYLVIDGNLKYFVRLGKDIPEHLISRNNELIASKAAANCLISPNVVYNDKGILVLDFIESITLTEKKVKNNILDIISIVKKIHAKMPEYIYGQSVIFWVFHVIQNYSKFLKDFNSSHKNLLEDLLIKSKKLEVISSPYEIVFGHNDLLPANFIDDGSRIWVIDWEYAGYNSPLFDLGGLASNNNFNFKEEIFLLENYFEKKINDNLLYKYNSMKCASLLRETMWSMVSEISSKIEFNYPQYTLENLNKFNKSFKSLEIK